MQKIRRSYEERNHILRSLEEDYKNWLLTSFKKLESDNVLCMTRIDIARNIGYA